MSIGNNTSGFAKEESLGTIEAENPYSKFFLSDEMITNMVVAHEAQMERLASGKYLTATAQTLGLAS